MRYRNLRYSNPTGVAGHAFSITVPDLACRMRRDDRAVHDQSRAALEFIGGPEMTHMMHLMRLEHVAGTVKCSTLSPS